MPRLQRRKAFSRGSIHDDAVKLAHHTVESCLLSAYSSGALFHDGQFAARLVEAFRTTLDQMPALVEDALREDECGLEQSRPSDS